MALQSKELWFIGPLQAIAMLGAAVNFGGSVLQTPLVMPTLALSSVPIQHTAAQIRFLVRESEKYFPPLNMLCTLSNLTIVITACMHRDLSLTRAKLPYAVIGMMLNLSTTAWALTVMVPLNKSMARDATVLEKDSVNEVAMRTLKGTQSRWRRLNLVRASMMLSASVADLLGLMVGVW